MLNNHLSHLAKQSSLLVTRLLSTFNINNILKENNLLPKSNPLENDDWFNRIRSDGPTHLAKWFR